MDVAQGNASEENRAAAKRVARGWLCRDLTLPAPPIHRPETTADHLAAITRVILRIRANLTERLAVEELAREARMEKSQLHDVFKQLTGTSPGHFQFCLRIQEAKSRLLTTDCSVTDICFDLGYSSGGTFSTKFKDSVGYSPTEFRERAMEFDFEAFRSRIGHRQSARHNTAEPQLRGRLHDPEKPFKNLIVGTYQDHVPLGLPLSSTLANSADSFLVRCPALPAFTMVVFSLPSDCSDTELLCCTNKAILRASHQYRLGRTGVLQTLTEGSLAWQSLFLKDRRSVFQLPNISLRPARLTDPPILTALQLFL